PPREDAAVLARDPHDARLTQARPLLVLALVHDEGVAIGPERDVRRPVEERPGRAGAPALAELEQERAVPRELEHAVVADVGDPDVALGIRADTMRLREHPATPAPQHVRALAVEHEDGIGLRAAVQDVDLACGVARHPGDAAELPSRGHRAARPLVRELLAEADLHAVLEPLAVRVDRGPLGRVAPPAPGEQP